MIMDNKGKLFGKVSIVDIVIVLIIIGAIGGFAYKYMKSDSATPFARTTPIEIQLYAEEVPTFAVTGIKPGDVVSDGVKGNVFGKVTDSKVGNSMTYGFDTSGKSVTSSKEGYSSLTVTATGNGVYSDAGVNYDGTVYYIGKSMEIRIGNSTVWGRISSFKSK